MEQQLAPYIKYTENDRLLKTPVLSIEIEPDRIVSLTDQYGIIATIRREEDGSDTPCIFHWDTCADFWGPSRFLLLHHTSDGLEKIEPDPVDPSPESLILNEWSGNVHHLMPGQKFRVNIGHPVTYGDHLVPGERYELLWPGAKISLWNWGSRDEHLGQDLNAGSQRPPLILPGGAYCSLTVIEEAQNFPSPPSPPPLERSDQILGTPCLAVVLESPSMVTENGSLSVTTKVTYDGLVGDDGKTGAADAKPIILHKLGLVEGFRLYRRRHDYNSKNDDKEWEHVDEETCFRIVEGPDVSVNVTKHESFMSLRPGDSWIHSTTLTPWSLHPDTVVGDIYRYQNKGGAIDWWDWGDCEGHANTVVKLPPWLAGEVIDPPDNGGRPKLVVPASNVVEFTIVE